MGEFLKPGARVRHNATGERGTVRELLPSGQAYVDWGRTGKGVAWRHDLIDATPIPPRRKEPHG